MKLYNERLGKIIEGTPMMAKLLAVKGWVELLDETQPEHTSIEGDVIELTIDDSGEVIATPIYEEKYSGPTIEVKTVKRTTDKKSKQTKNKKSK